MLLPFVVIGEGDVGEVDGEVEGGAEEKESEGGEGEDEGAVALFFLEIKEELIEAVAGEESDEKEGADEISHDILDGVDDKEIVAEEGEEVEEGEGAGLIMALVFELAAPEGGEAEEGEEDDREGVLEAEEGPKDEGAVDLVGEAEVEEVDAEAAGEGDIEEAIEGGHVRGAERWFLGATPGEVEPDGEAEEGEGDHRG